MSTPIDAHRAIVIEAVSPELDCGRYPVKREVGDVMEVEADVFRDGHDRVAAAVRFRIEGEDGWWESPMRALANDRWRGAFRVERNARYLYTVVAWTDRWATWADELRKKFEAGQEVTTELREGAELVAAATERARRGPDRRAIERFLRRISGSGEIVERVAAALDRDLLALMEAYPDRSDLTEYEAVLPLQVDRVAARFAAWYEIFPRSMSDDPDRHGTWDDVIAKLPYVRDMGFDVLYFPPVHPIGVAFRKGKNNTLNAGTDQPGSPYAIGGAEGGHTAVHPQLGTLEDFRRTVEAAREHGLEIALDFAIQVSPDHPYVEEHPGWFFYRADGTIRYAENPPKKYQDIFPLDFYGDDWEAQWREWRDVILFWVGQGVRIFRVDNPHTKPVQFWEWMIREVQREHPDVIFLAEAFTRPKMMRVLAKAGFTQSYTYFTWRTEKAELTEYFTELTQGPMREYFRGNLFPNTPDILHEFLQNAPPSAFRIRAVLAATLSSVYGIYSGFELCEGTPLPGREEYLDSEKYEIRAWDWDRPGNIRPLIRHLNWLRRGQPALREYDNLRFHPCDNPSVLFYAKWAPDGTHAVFVAVSLDPYAVQEALLDFPTGLLGISDEMHYDVEELLSGERYLWQRAFHRVRLDPDAPARIFRIEVRGAYRSAADPLPEPRSVGESQGIGRGSTPPPGQG
ncbi:MAG: alpha-1,4-glucan--maltose-1-phosphate maltosyltransferase [Gemmatimonadota bacterium]|nr:alpha-1,4-glucan--maltose-1-phosphate maltosyltransferase [Gemmatimonadota bacterium]